MRVSFAAPSPVGLPAAASGLRRPPASRGLPTLATRSSRGAAGKGQAAAAAGKPAGGSGGGSGGQPERRNEERTFVTFRVPGEAPVEFERLTQADLSDFLRLNGANGFRTANGKVSRRLADLPNGATVDLALPKEPPIKDRVINLERAAANRRRGNEQQLCGFLRDVASKEHAGSPIAMLSAEPFEDLNQQDYVQLDAAVRADDVLYLGEHKSVLGETGVADIKLKLEKIRLAKKLGVSPDLSAALRGVTHVKLFLAGEAVRAGMTLDTLASMAATEGASVVLPSGQALGLAAGPAPAVPL